MARKLLVRDARWHVAVTMSGDCAPKTPYRSSSVGTASVATSRTGVPSSLTVTAATSSLRTMSSTDCSVSLGTTRRGSTPRPKHRPSGKSSGMERRRNRVFPTACAYHSPIGSRTGADPSRSPRDGEQLRRSAVVPGRCAVPRTRIGRAGLAVAANHPHAQANTLVVWAATGRTTSRSGCSRKCRTRIRLCNGVTTRAAWSRGDRWT
jgi:hypothetical protein